MQKYALYLLAPLLSMGCFSSPEKQMATPISTPSIESSWKVLEQNDCVSSYILPREWWQIFKDPQLCSLIEQALVLNPSLQKAEAKIVEAQAKAKMVRSHLFPKLSANATENWQYLSKYGLFRDFFPTIPGFPVPHKFNETIFSLDFSYEVDFFGKNQKMLQAALGKALAEQMEKRQAELLVCTMLAYTYFSWQSHLAELNLYEDLLSCNLSLLDIARRRYTEGVDSKRLSLVQEEDICSLQQQIDTTRKEIAIDEAFLQELLGVGPIPLSLSPKWEPEDLSLELPSSLPIDILCQRPDVMARHYRLEAARQDVGVAKLEFYPNVNLLAMGGFSSLSFSHLFEWASRTGSLRPAIHLPLFTGGELQGNLSEKTAIFNEAVCDYNAQVLESAKEVLSEIATYVSVHKQIAQQNSKLGAQKNLLVLAEASYTVGTQGYETVLIEKQDLLSLETELTALYQYKIVSFLRLIKALGGGWGEEPWKS